MRSQARFEDNEETPLLNQDPSNKPTPLPIAQVSILVLPFIAEAFASLSISPYINQVCCLFWLCATDRYLFRIQLVRDLPIVGGDERKVGYYTGVIVRVSTCFCERVPIRQGRITGLPALCFRGNHRIFLESPFRSHRPKACSPMLPRGYNRFNGPIRTLPFFPGHRLQVPPLSLHRPLVM